MAPKRIVLLCTALNEIGGTSRHMAQIFKSMDRRKFLPFIVFSSTQEDRLKAFFKQEGCPEEFIKTVPVVSRQPAGAWGALKRLWKEIQPDVVHSFFLHSDIMSFATTIGGKTRRISSVEGKFIWDSVNNVGSYKNLCYRIFNQWIRGAFARTVTVSEDLKAEVVKAGAKFNYVTVIPVGLPAPEEGSLSRRPQAPVTVGYLGRFSQDKGGDLFIRTVALCKDLTEVKFIMGGGGQEEQSLKSLAAELGAPVEFAGWIDDVSRFLNTIDIYVMPSRREGCPLGLIEAMHHKKAIAVFNVPGVNEIVKDGRTALVAQAFDLNSMANHIRTLVHDENLRAQLGNNAREEALKNYSVSKEAFLIDCLYSEVTA